MRSHELKLDKLQREEIIARIKAYFEEEREEFLGDLAAGLLLDFFLETLGPALYNAGIQDAYRYLEDRLEDMMALQKPEV
ncbi:DUF2164 family protein [Proteiniclasticum sp. BAD-10]|uniref:DUF2164 family protein n=1 Tax=Proteiniclasticum sediminis TaxID=2804028 RepID=A0A941CNY7_9CLOT|nr:DUF2164 family protein [Proteiniclasticum sediminis]MBR0576211.1 DUF2164 family protein [Proteiniclasticum sediminis]